MYTAIIVLAAIGLLISFYVLYVEQKLEKNAAYKPVCDISDKASCTTVFKSKYAKTFGIRNSFHGIGLFIVYGVLAYLQQPELLFALGVVAALFSLYFLRILYGKLKDFCIVCTLTHAVNIAIVVLSAMIMFG